MLFEGCLETLWEPTAEKKYANSAKSTMHEAAGRVTIKGTTTPLACRITRGDVEPAADVDGVCDPGM